jgi:hypothetical protein
LAPEVIESAESLCQDEVSQGKAKWISVVDALQKVLTPRFVIDQGFKLKKGVQIRSLRLIDDFTASMVNLTAALGEKCSHDYIDTLVGLIQLLSSNGGKVRLRKDDFVGAYKTLPLKTDELDLAVAIIKVAGGKVRALQLLSCPFGAVGSVHAWHRVGAAIQFILAKLFGVAYPRYVDDLFGADVVQPNEQEGPYTDFATPTGTAELVRWVIQGLLGWDLDGDKEVTDAETMRVLGVEVSITDVCVRVCIPSEKISQWVTQIQNILHAGHLTPTIAGKLAGKLSWGACEVFGKGARVYLAPLFRHSCQNSVVLNSRLRRSLEWWLRFLPKAPVRDIPLTPSIRRRAVVYSDATGGGHLSWVADLGSYRVFSRATIPPWLKRWVHRRRNQVATWELVAAVSALWFLFDELRRPGPQWEVQMFIDSIAALGTLLRGSSRQEDWNTLVTELWFRTATEGILLGAWWVPSKLNVADAPTRSASKAKDMETLIKAGFQEVAWKWPRQWLKL